jgi:hypothetical protein
MWQSQTACSEENNGETAWQTQLNFSLPTAHEAWRFMVLNQAAS